MVSFPNCKINIGLNILGKRPDGFHDLQTIFYPVAVKDALEIIEANHPSNDVTFSSSGIPVPGEEKNNLCIKAYHLLKKDFHRIPPVQVHLHKAIPMGAGLGGGSADAAFMLQLLNNKFELNLSTEQLINYALQLGSDCPFFIVNMPCYATGRGEELEKFSLDLSPYKILLVHPGIHVSTADAFSAISITTKSPDLKELIQQPPAKWKGLVVNDFEKTVFNKFPDIRDIKDKLYKHSALYASMTGSGSCVYGIFQKDNIPVINFPAHYFCQWV